MSVEKLEQYIAKMVKGEIIIYTRKLHLLTSLNEMFYLTKYSKVKQKVGMLIKALKR